MFTPLHPVLIASIASLVIFAATFAYALLQLRRAKKALYAELSTSFDAYRRQSERRRAFNRHCRKQLEAYGRATAAR